MAGKSRFSRTRRRQSRFHRITAARRRTAIGGPFQGGFGGPRHRPSTEWRRRGAAGSRHGQSSSSKVPHWPRPPVRVQARVIAPGRAYGTALRARRLPSTTACRLTPPAIAVHLGMNALTNCVNVKLENGAVIVTRPISTVRCTRTWRWTVMTARSSRCEGSVSRPSNPRPNRRHRVGFC